MFETPCVSTPRRSVIVSTSAASAASSGLTTSFSKICVTVRLNAVYAHWTWSFAGTLKRSSSVARSSLLVSGCMGRSIVTEFRPEEKAMTTVGSGRYTYELIENWATLPAGWTFGGVSAVATDSQDRVYAFQRKDPPVIVFDRHGQYLGSWGSSVFADPHGINIVDDVIYVADRNDHVALKFTLDGRPLLVVGERGKASDTGATKDIELPPRSAGPFNKPTEMMVAPSGDLYVTDGYRNSRVHRFSGQGALIDSWGEPGKTDPGQFHLPHSL